MDTYLSNGDMEFDLLGDVKKVSGLREIIQRINIRLKMKKGSFPYNVYLGSELYSLDINSLDDIKLKSIVESALSDMDNVIVNDVEKMVDFKNKILYLTVYLNISGETILVEIKNNLWEGI